MKKKQFIGIVAFFIGLALIFFALFEKHRIAKAKGELSSGASFFSGNTWGKMVGSSLQHEASKYDTTVQIIFIGGIVLAILGASVAILYRKK